MLLQRLAEYADRLALPPALYSEAPVRYIVELDREGCLLSPQPTDTADPASPRTRRGAHHAVPQVQRSSATRPLLFADNAKYTFGIVRVKGKEARAAKDHHAYLDLVERCAAQTGEPAAAVWRFLSNDPLSRLQLPPDFDAGATLTFRVDGSYVVDADPVAAFWAAEEAHGDSPIMQCLVCGEQRPALRRQQAKIKIHGGHTSGTALLSANEDAFVSYGLDASLVAPTCGRCGERVTKALNTLLADRSTHLVLGGLTFAFWTRQPVAFSLYDLLTDPSPEQVRALIDSARHGRTPPPIEDEEFYAIALSASGGRAVVRDWIDTTVSEISRHLALWFTRQEIVSATAEPPHPYRLFTLAAATVRDPNELTPPTPQSLLHGALTGAPLPYSLLANAIRRNAAEQRVTRPRAALIKLVLATHTTTEEDRMGSLDPDNTNPAYRCGRLLAVLEEVQSAAIHTTTIVDRFYGTASTAPASVFGRLMRGAQPHLAKLERDNPGAYYALQQRLEDTLSGLDTFPLTLSLQDQGLFALGYYHQRAFSHAQAREHTQSRKAAAVAASQGETNTAEPAKESA